MLDKFITVEQVNTSPFDEVLRLWRFAGSDEPIWKNADVVVAMQERVTSMKQNDPEGFTQASKRVGFP